MVGAYTTVKRRIDDTSVELETGHILTDSKLQVGEKVSIRRRAGGRPAHTYRANKKSKGSSRSRTPGAVISHDRLTDRSIQRSQARSNAGRWPGIGDPAAVASTNAMREREAEIAMLKARREKENARKRASRAAAKKGTAV